MGSCSVPARPKKHVLVVALRGREPIAISPKNNQILAQHVFIVVLSVRGVLQELHLYALQQEEHILRSVKDAPHVSLVFVLQTPS